MAAADVARLTSLAEAFSPSAPIDHQALFAGRMSQMTDVLNAISQKGQHAPSSIAATATSIAGASASLLIGWRACLLAMWGESATR